LGGNFFFSGAALLEWLVVKAQGLLFGLAGG